MLLDFNAIFYFSCFFEIIGAYESVYMLIKDRDMTAIGQNNTLSITKEIDLVSCLSRCLQIQYCALVRYHSNLCKQFKQVEYQNFFLSNGNFLYQKKSINLNKNLYNGLINHWSFTHNYDDSIRQANLYNGLNYKLTDDRFGNPNSALELSNGYLQVPPGVYFNGKFTFTAWVYPKSFSFYARLFDFGNGSPSDNVFFALCNSADFLPFLEVYFGNAFQDMLLPRDIQVPSLNIKINDWSHFAVQFDGGSFLFYLNGVLTSKRTGAMGPPNVIRNFNYFGKSNWVSDAYVNAIFDEIRIYDRVLGQSEIFELLME